jgi:hypothetical protein
MSNKIDPFEGFVSDKNESDSSESYIIPNIETKLPKRKRDECREIVKEIKDFGISQRQLLYTIYLLALELENVTAMKSLSKTIGEIREFLPVNALYLEDKEIVTQKDNPESEKKASPDTIAPPAKKKLIL